MKTPVVMSWSGGKDGAVALQELLRDDQFEVVALMTSMSEEYRRVSHHGVRETLVDQQAAAVGLPLKKVYLPSENNRPCTNAVYKQMMGAALAGFRAQGIRTVAFGDLFLEDLRAWREASLAEAGMSGLFPVWGRDTTQFANDFIRSGFRAYLSCVEGTLGPQFVGRELDEDLLRDLPAGIDPCGERGEFHSFVYDGPIFAHPVPVTVGEIATRDGRHYADLLPRGVLAAKTPLGELIPPV